jgi:hypothetical protein
MFDLILHMFNFKTLVQNFNLLVILLKAFNYLESYFNDKLNLYFI